MAAIELRSVALRLPAEANLVLGQAHFIKTVEDLAEIMATAAPQARWGLAFNESSGPCLTRAEGNDPELRAVAIEDARSLEAGHVFVLLLRGAFPLQVLDRIKSCPEVCGIYCATGNPVEVILAASERGCGVLGVVDGARPRGVEGEADVAARRAFLRRIGYKL